MSDVDLVLHHIKDNNVFLTGGAGVEKSYTTTEIIRIPNFKLGTKKQKKKQKK